MNKILIAGNGRRVEIVNLEDADDHCDGKQSLRVTSELSTGVNFTNILCTPFTLVDLECVKKIENLTVLFVLLGSEHIKAVHRMLMKLSPVVDFCNIFTHSHWVGRSQKCKNTDNLTVFFYAFGLFSHKSCT